MKSHRDSFIPIAASAKVATNPEFRKKMEESGFARGCDERLHLGVSQGMGYRYADEHR